MIIKFGDKKRMFTNNFANLLGSYERRALLAFSFNNNWIIRAKLSNEYQNHGLPRTSDLSSIPYSITDKKNGWRKWCYNRAIRKGKPRPTEAIGKDDGNDKSTGKGKRASDSPKSSKWCCSARIEKGGSRLPTRIFPSICINVAYAANGRFPIWLRTSLDTDIWSGTELWGEHGWPNNDSDLDDPKEQEKIRKKSLEQSESNEAQRKLELIEERLKAVEGSDVYGLVNT